jgi:phage antirepressor YoqD-like protein
MKKKLKTKLHFNRVNMQRGNPNIWTAHNSRGCFQTKKLVIMHNGKILAETVFKPDAPQPRAYFVAKAEVKCRSSKVIIEV